MLQSSTIYYLIPNLHRLLIEKGTKSIKFYFFVLFQTRLNRLVENSDHIQCFVSNTRVILNKIRNVRREDIFYTDILIPAYLPYIPKPKLVWQEGFEWLDPPSLNGRVVKSRFAVSKAKILVLSRWFCALEHVQTDVRRATRRSANGDLQLERTSDSWIWMLERENS